MLLVWCIYMLKHALTLLGNTYVPSNWSCCRAEVGASQHVEVFCRPSCLRGRGLPHGHHGNVLWFSWSLSRNFPHLSRWSCSGFLVTVLWPNWTFQQSPTPAFHGSRQTTSGSTPLCVGGDYYCLFCCQCVAKWMRHSTKPALTASGSIMRCWLYWQYTTSISKG